jgi:hypothetical protein
MYYTSKCFIIVVILAIVGFLTIGTVYGSTVDGYAYKNGETNHSGIAVRCLTCYLPHDTLFTNSSGYFGTWDIVGGQNHAFEYSYLGFVTDTLEYWIPINSQVHLPAVTLNRGLCGSLSGTLGSGDWPVVCNISVQAGNTLRISPGAHLLFEGDYSFDINGSLRAIGSYFNPIVFTRHFQTEQSKWGGIHFHSTSPCSLKYGRVEYTNQNNSGIYCNNGSPIINHCVISNNTIGIYYCGNADVSLINCTISKNLDYGIESPASEFPTWNLTAKNSIIYFNDSGSIVAMPISARYCDIEDGWDGEGNIDCDPLFTSPSNGDFHITWNNFPKWDGTKSCCIDSGDSASPKDPDGSKADIGAYYFNQPYLWVTWDQSSPGKPTEIEVVSCDDNATRLRIVSHGMYIERYVVFADTFWKYSLPQTDGRDTVYATTLDTGRCEIPRITRLIGLPTDVSQVSMTIDSMQSVYLTDHYVTYPLQGPLYDDDPDSSTFYWDSLFYSTTETLYPYDPHNPPSLEFQSGWFHHLKVVPFTVYPISSVPHTGQVLAVKRMSVTLHHTGASAGYDTLHISRLYDNIYGGSTINWGCIKDKFQGFLPYRNAKYLVIYADKYANAIMPLVTWKKLKGLDVQKISVSSIGNSYDLIKNYITGFYDGCKCCDIFILLVGDKDEVATGTYTYKSSSGDSDYKYACVKGDDPFPELCVGRLSPESESNLSDIINKILKREWTIPGGDWYTKVLLVANKQAYPKKYTECKERIRTYDYFWQAPTFDTCYGGSGANNSCVTNAINEGRNIVNYRGHGSVTSWSAWASDGIDWTIDNVNGLNNESMTPIVFSIACSNNDISYNECIGEKWLQVTNKGAVAHYGASVPSYTEPNHDLDRYLFKEIYDTSRIRVLGPVVNTAQVKTITLWEEEPQSSLAEHNAFIYILLGDPEMHIRTMRKFFSPLARHYLIRNEPFSGTVLDADSVPVKDALVTLYDSLTEQNPNYYTLDNGSYSVNTFPNPPLSDSITVCVTEPDFEPYKYKITSERLIRGDVNYDKNIDVSDVVYLINYLYKGGDPPVPILEIGDCNCDNIVEVGDIVYLITYLYRSGSEPYCP